MKITKSLPLQALINAIAGSLYVILVAWFMFHVVQFMPKDDTFLAPATFLMVLVLSAAIEGALILGQPIMLFLENKKAEALKLFATTLIWLLLITLLLIIAQLR